MKCTAALLAAALVLPLISAQGTAAEMQVEHLEFSALPGWEKDDHEGALRVFAASCGLIKVGDPDASAAWRHVCLGARNYHGAARVFFENNFQPVIFGSRDTGMLTAYFEPELAGTRYPDATFRYPLYRVPPELRRGKPWKTRAEITAGALAGRGLELVWLRDPVDAFFVHVQGSARIHLREGGTMRVGFAGRNGHPYLSIGKEFARRGLIDPHRVSAGRIRRYVKAHPAIGRQILDHNPSYIFFREIKPKNQTDGPIGAMGVPVTAMRSIAVDPRIIPLGAPVWVEMEGSKLFPRLMVAQDVGSAIKGAQRGDIFLGSGALAGQRAGRIRNRGRMVALLPKPARSVLLAGD